MENFFIRKIVSVWAFDKLGEAVWKCGNVGKLKITQEGNTIRKRDAQGATIFRMDTAKSANISFEVPYWDFNILSAISGAEFRELDGSQNPFKIEAIAVPYVQSRTLTSEDIVGGYLTLDQIPRTNNAGYREIALHKVDGADAIITAYQQGLVEDETHFSVRDNALFFPTSLNVGDCIETVYEYNSNYGIELANTDNSSPETWKVRILMLVSPVCNTDAVSAVWITAKNAKPDINLSLDFGTEDNIPIRLELGYSLCDDKKRLYEIVTVGQLDGEEELKTYDTQTVYTFDQNPITTIR